VMSGHKATHATARSAHNATNRRRIMGMETAQWMRLFPVPFP
jgi:hypothetical protein